MKKIFNQLQNIPYRASQLVMKKVVQTFKFPVPPILEGSGMVRRFPEIIKLTGVNCILVVTDNPLLSTGRLDDFLCALEALHIEPIIYSKVLPNPTFQNVEEGLDLYLRENCNGVVAFGGGSVLDCGKIIAAEVTNRKPLLKIRGLFKLNHKLPPFFAVPTTSGTGSEGTISAIITKNHEKFTITDPKLVPLATVLDPELTMTLAPNLTATTGMSALTHAIEAYIGKYDTDDVKEKALEATNTIINTLETCYENGENKNIRLALAKASFNAGLSFTRASAGYTHAFAHVLGGFYDISTSLVNAVVLPFVLEFYGDSIHKKLSELAFYSGLGEAMQSSEHLSDLLIKKIKSMNETFGIPQKLEALDSKDIPLLAKRILKEANPTYPVPKIMHYDECLLILEKLSSKNF